MFPEWCAMTGSGVRAGGTWVAEFPGQRRPFEAGNLAAVRHGAFSKQLTGPLAEAIAAEQLARDDCPSYLRDPSYAAAVMAWAYAEAEVRKLRERRDQLDELAGSMDASLTEVTTTEETETRLAPGALTRTGVVRQREALANALHRSEGRARMLRNDLGLSPLSRARLGRDVLGARADLALIWAAEADGDGTSGDD